MSELEDKLNSLLSNQDAMAQVMQLAQSLSQSGAGATDGGSAAPPPPPQAEWPGAVPPAQGRQSPASAQNQPCGRHFLWAVCGGAARTAPCFRGSWQPPTPQAAGGHARGGR